MIRFLFLPLLLLGCSQGCNSDSNEEESAIVDPIHWDDCGYEVGDHACDFSLTDQNGKSWSLYENYGKIMIIDFSTEWCGYCHVAAEETQSIYEHYNADNNFSYVTIIVEDMSGNSPPSEQAIQRWVEHYSITAPVLIGSREMIGDDQWPIQGWPTFFIVNEDLVITHIVRGYNESTIRSAVDSLVNSL